MTKLIALIAILAAAAWAITAAASWLTQRSSPRALAAGKVPPPPTASEHKRAMLVAQLRTGAALVFALVVFVSLFRISIGFTGQAGQTVTLLASLSTSGGILLFSAVPSKKLPAAQPGTGTAKSEPNALVSRELITPAAILAVFAAFIMFTGTDGAHGAPDAAYLPWRNGLPALLAAAILTGSALLALRKIRTTLALPDPRMTALDLRWRHHASKNLLLFTNGALLSSFGATVIVACTAASGVTFRTIITAAGGAALAMAGVVLLVMAVKATLTLRSRVLEGASAGQRMNTAGQ